MSDLLLELFGEEIPASMQARAAKDLKRLVCNSCRVENLTYETEVHNCLYWVNRMLLALLGHAETMYSLVSYDFLHTIQ